MNDRMLTVPIAVHRADDLPDYAERLRAAGAKRVFLCCLPHWIDGEEMTRQMELHRGYVTYFKEQGFEVGLWLHAFGFGVPLTESQKRICEGFTKLRDLRGREAGEAFCPTSEAFCRYMEDMIAKAAALPIDLLMLDDDFCQSVRPGVGCACETHLAEFRKRIGNESLTPEACNEVIFYNADKSPRRVWFDLQGETLAAFARRMREAVDRVNPSLRFGFCSGYTSWDFEGISAIDLTRILAGNTKPFVRTTGAPYWVITNRNSLNLKLQDIVEMTRAQREWCENTDIEIFDENDNYPRQSTLIPVSLQEGFDLAMAVDGGVAPFKYLFSYLSKPTCEDNYYEAHLRNRGALAQLRAAAEGKRDVGIRVREYRDKARAYDFDPKDEATFGAGKAQMGISFPRSHCIASRNAIPTVYGKASAEILFGENAKYIPLSELPKGAILDIRAAEILTERGVDVGLLSTEPYDAAGDEIEYIGGDRLALLGANRFGKATLAEGATLLSTVRSDLKACELPCSYRYENAEGNRFLVFCFDASSLHYHSSLFSHYERRKQLNAHLDWLGADVPFRMEGNYPNLYAMCKRGEGGELLIVLFNFTQDTLFDVRLRLTEDRSGKRLLARNVSLRTEQDTLILDRISAFDFAALEINP